MNPEIIVALITGAATVAGVIITNNKSNSAMAAQLDKAQAVTDTKIEALTEEVRKHNNFAERVPVIEVKLDEMDRRIDVIEKKVV